VAAGVPLQGANVSVGGTTAITDASGHAALTLPPGQFTIHVTKDGFEQAAVKATVVSAEQRAVHVALQAKPKQEDGTVVASTHTRVRVDDQALPVEQLARRSIDEGMAIAPSSIATLLDTVPGQRLQVTSPELGTAMVRMQGLRGQYTRLLSDGMPLYFDHPGGLAPVQIAPMDLDRVEVIPGGASALFGANAVAGAINLLSREPGGEPDRELLFNQSTRNGTDAIVLLSRPATKSWGSTFLFDGHREDEDDVDHDGWSDVPGESRGTARTRVFWHNRNGKSASGTAGVLFEKRQGGSTFAHQLLETKQADGTLSGEMPLGKYQLSGTGLLYVQSRDHTFIDAREHERRESAVLELRLRGNAPRQSYAVGIVADWYAIRTPLPSGYVAPRGGVFINDDLQVASWLWLSGSARLDYAKTAWEALRVDGFFFSPRGSALVRRGPWGARVSAGRSYSIPTPLTEETEAAGFARLSIAGPLEVETAQNVSGGVSHTTRASTVSFTVFHTDVDHPALVDRTTYTLHTDAEPVTTSGVELLGSARHAALSLTGTYTYLRAHERGGVETALTPRHSVGVIAAAGTERRGRAELRVRFTGTQRLDANPYRSTSEAYTVVSLLGERAFGRWRPFVSADNLTDVRQTRWDPIVRPTRDVDGRWTVDAWAPLRGRAINGGIRVAF